MRLPRPRLLVRAARRLAGPLLVVMIFLPAVGLAAMRIRSSPILLVELLVYVILLAALLWSSRIRSTFSALDRRRQWLIGSIIAAAIFAQLIGLPRLTYPFVDWTMYSQVHPANTFIRYDAVRESGHREHLPIDRLSPSTSPRAAMASLSILAQSEDESDHERLGTAIQGFTSIENRRNPTDPIVRVIVSRCSIEVSGAGAGEVACERLHVVEVQ